MLCIVYIFFLHICRIKAKTTKVLKFIKFYWKHFYCIYRKHLQITNLFQLKCNKITIIKTFYNTMISIHLRHICKWWNPPHIWCLPFLLVFISQVLNFKGILIEDQWKGTYISCIWVNNIKKPNNISQFSLLRSEKQKGSHWSIRSLSKRLDYLRNFIVDCPIFLFIVFWNFSEPNSSMSVKMFFEILK